MSEIFSCCTENAADFLAALLLREIQWFHLKQARFVTIIICFII